LVEVEKALTKIFKLLESFQYLVEVEQDLTKFFKLLKAVSIYLSELVLLLLNTDRLQKFEEFCQSLFYFY
jgi:hypothetical protein